MTISPLGSYITQKSLEVAIDNLIVARFPTAFALRKNADAIAELLHDSIQTFSIRTGIRTARFEEAYSSAVRVTLTTLDKPHLRGVCRFERLPVIAALRWLKSRLLSNLKTVLTNPKSAEWLGHVKIDDFDIATFGNAEIEAELAGLSREQIVSGLKSLFLEGTDIGELEYLCDRFDIKTNEIMSKYAIPVIVERSPQGNPQLTLDF